MADFQLPPFDPMAVPRPSTLTPEQQKAVERRNAGTKKRLREKKVKEILTERREVRRTARQKADLKPKEMRDRGEAMLARRLEGNYLTDIAKWFNTTEAAAKEEIQMARRRAVAGKSLEYIGQVLIPKALAVYTAALDQGDTEIATKVLEAVGVGGKQSILQLNPGTGAEGDSYEAWRLEISRTTKTLVKPADPAVIDVQALPQEESKDASE